MGLLYKFFQLFLRFCLRCDLVLYMLLSIGQYLGVGGFLIA